MGRIEAYLLKQQFLFSVMERLTTRATGKLYNFIAN